jgi:hypothetical protein
MRAFLLACVAAIAVASIGAAALSELQEPVSEAFATSAVRL